MLSAFAAVASNWIIEIDLSDNNPHTQFSLLLWTGAKDPDRRAPTDPVAFLKIAHRIMI